MRPGWPLDVSFIGKARGPDCAPHRLVPIQSYRDLLVWQKSLRLAKDVERLAARLPAAQREGWAQPTKVYIHHLVIALGSEAELQTELRHTANLSCVSQSEIQDLLDRTSEIGRMLRGLVRSLRVHLAESRR